MKRCLGHRQHILSLLLLGALQGQCVTSPRSPSAGEIINRVVARAESAHADRQLAHYAYTKRAITEDFDGKGRVKERTEKIFRIKSGFGYLQQMKINGQTVSGAELKKQDQSALQIRQQFTESKSDRRDETWEAYLTSEMADKYRYTLLGEESINGRLAYVIAFQPASGNLPVKHFADRLLNQLAGTIWVDEKEFEVAKADISLQSKVTLGGMMEVIGALRKFHLTLERVRLEENVWFNRWSAGDFEGRKLWDATHVKTWSESSNFQKLSSAEPLGRPRARR